MKQVVWLDVDGVLLDYTRAFITYAKLNTHYDLLDNYDLTRLFDSPDTCYKVMASFSSSDAFKRLPKIASPVLLQSLVNLGYELRIISKVPDMFRARENRLYNLTRKFGPVFSEVVFTDKECKLDYLSNRKMQEPLSQYILVEDNPTLLAKADYMIARDPDIIDFLEVQAVRHPYNASVVDLLKFVPVARSFDEIATYLIQRVI